MQSKQTCSASIAARLHGGEHAAVGSLTKSTAAQVYFLYTIGILQPYTYLE